MFFEQLITTAFIHVPSTALLAGFLDIIASKEAILAYVMVLLILLAVLVVFIVSDTKKRDKHNVIIAADTQKLPVSTQTKTVVSNGKTGANPTLVAPMSATNTKNRQSNDGTSRFCMLSRIDANKAKYREKGFHTDITLKKFCDDFRNYASNKLNLYYNISDIRAFIAGMAVSQILILQGMSGTGKTSLAHAMGSFLENTSTVIPVQPMWKERTDMLGYYNEFTKRFNETLLLEKMYEANYSEDIYVTVLDEMNIARVEYYFAEFLSLLNFPIRMKDT